MKNKALKNVLAIVLIFAIFYAITYLINSNITIRGLYKDDLASWSWFPGLSFYDFAIKFYDSATRYRPVFYALEYIEYYIVGTHVKWFTYINVFLNSIIATFVYKFAKKNSNSNFIAFAVSMCYIISHFSYYQITQVIGILETYSQLFALIVLYLCIIYIENNNHNNLKLSFLFILYFLASFTHERYMFLAVPIFFALTCNYILNKSNNKKVLTTYIIFILEIALIIYIRILSTGKFIPSGTGGTEVNETFNLIEALTFSINQVLFIFGINIGPEHLVGMPYNNTSIPIRILLFISIIILLSIILVYILSKAKYIKKSINNNTSLLYYLYKDILYIGFIMLAIGSSSVTIRVEMRFVYVSFTASMLYLAHMLGEIKIYSNDFTHKSDNYLNTDILYNIKHITKKKCLLIIYILFICFFLSRNYVEFCYRKTYPKIHCVTDLLRVNSLADLTVYKYGIDELKKKRVYILYNYYEWTAFYREYFYKIYDKTNEGLTIGLINSPEDIPKDFDKNNDILLFEDIANYGYQDITQQFIPD